MIYKNTSAFGGKGYRAKKITNKKSDFSTSEYHKIKKILLAIPGIELDLIKKPNQFQHLDKISSKKLIVEIKKIITFFKSKKIQVVLHQKISKENFPENIVFCRDQVWASPDGLIIGRMGSEIRKPEELYVFHTGQINNLKIRGILSSESIFEAADILWIDKDECLIGINNRTNLQAVKELQHFFPKIKFHIIKLPKATQHLLGLINIFNKKECLLRHEIAPKKLKDILLKKNFNIISLCETPEVVQKNAMNIVTISPRVIIMPDDCPETENIYRQNKIMIIKKFSIKELRKAAGGLGCLVGILERASR